MIDLKLQRHAFVALAAAALFGASTPLAKVLLAEVQPVMLAALLYLGSGAGLLAARAAVRLGTRALARMGSAGRGQAATGGPDAAQGSAARPDAGPLREAPLTRADLPWLGGAILCGGVLAPMLLLWGLRATSASSASLLLNLEGVLTTLLAAAMFREAVGARAWGASLLILAGGVILSWPASGNATWDPAVLAIAGACLLWALDNNLTRKVSGGDPVVIAIAKGSIAGTVNLALALALGQALPGWNVLGAALALGFLSYGVSLVLFIHALRHLGSARAAAHFGTAPFIGALLSVLVLGDPLSGGFVAALALMLLATWLLLREQHGHTHTHEPLTHTHRHVHDAHHRHEHAEGGEPPSEAAAHVHAHTHAPITHAHPHLPDLHHRHRH